MKSLVLSMRGPLVVLLPGSCGGDVGDCGDDVGDKYWITGEAFDSSTSSWQLLLGGGGSGCLIPPS